MEVVEAKLPENVEVYLCATDFDSVEQMLDRYGIEVEKVYVKVFEGKKAKECRLYKIPLSAEQEKIVKKSRASG